MSDILHIGVIEYDFGGQIGRWQLQFIESVDDAKSLFNRFKHVFAPDAEITDAYLIQQDSENSNSALYENT